MSSRAGDNAVARCDAVGAAHTGSPSAPAPVAAAQRSTRAGAPRPRAGVPIGHCEVAGCHAGLASWTQYVDHLRAEHGYDFRSQRCDVCLASPGARKLSAHRSMHDRKNWMRVECDQCDAAFFGAPKCELHVIGFHGGHAFPNEN